MILGTRFHQLKALLDSGHFLSTGLSSVCLPGPEAVPGQGQASVARFPFRDLNTRAGKLPTSHAAHFWAQGVSQPGTKVGSTSLTPAGEATEDTPHAVWTGPPHEAAPCRRRGEEAPGPGSAGSPSAGSKRPASGQRLVQREPEHGLPEGRAGLACVPSTRALLRL